MDVPTKNPATSAVTYTADNEIQPEKPAEEARFLQNVAKPDRQDGSEKFPDENCSGPDYERWVAYRRKKEQQVNEVAYEASPTKIRNLNLILWRLLDNNSDDARGEWGNRRFLTASEIEWLRGVDRKQPMVGDYHEAQQIERRVCERRNKKWRERTADQPTANQPPPDQPTADQPAPSRPKHKLMRVAFTVSRLMEFCSKRELENQTASSTYDWPLVVLKELFDNALDACEEAEVTPIVEVIVGPGFIAIADNADGIAAATISSILDYTIRVSSREAYVSPTRGAQGNALKTILAMAYVLDREREDGDINADAVGVTIIESQGVRHRIEFKVDHVKNEPKIVHTTLPCDRTVGTKITIEWPTSERLLEYAKPRFKFLTSSYVFFNPHLTLRGVWHGEQFVNIEATNPNWQKWGPRDPTSPHWYNESRLQRYLAAHVARDHDLGRDRTVREFIAEFRGLSGTAVQRRILAEVGCSHQSLAQFFGIDQVNRVGIAKLLAAMKRHSKPVNPKLLGIIGSEHLKARFLAAGGNAETFKYEQRKGFTGDGIPYLIEFAFGLHQSALEAVPALGAMPATESRTIVTGANWSVGIYNPFRTFGSTGEGLDSTLAQVRANAKEPVICALHLASAHVQYADRGKSSIILTDDARQPDV